ncbi:NADH-ubiquinone oxidoreductase 14.8 kDa subunit, partial [Hypoxylon sp. FL1857]
MAVTPTQFARTTRTSANWNDAKRRVLAAYREWIRAAPEIQTMYSVPFPVSVIRTRMRQEFERHRFVNKLPVVDVLLMQNNAEYQVSLLSAPSTTTYREHTLRL